MSARKAQPAKPVPSASSVARTLSDQAEDRFGEEEGKYGDGQAQHEDYEEKRGSRDAAHRDFRDEKPESGEGP